MNSSNPDSSQFSSHICCCLHCCIRRRLLSISLHLHSSYANQSLKNKQCRMKHEACRSGKLGRKKELFNTGNSCVCFSAGEICDVDESVIKCSKNMANSKYFLFFLTHHWTIIFLLLSFLFLVFSLSFWFWL
jgi:hypothetical protein